MSIKELQDVNGNVIHPETEMAAIADADKLVNTTSTQNNIAGIKNFVDGISIKGVPLSFDSINFGKSNSVPNNDLQAISKSGLYYYTGAEKNLPPRDTWYRNGYIIANFTDANNGIVLLIGGVIYLEKYKGEWRKPFSPQPMTLWSGDAKPGDKLTLVAPIQNFNYLRFYLHDVGLDSNYVVISSNHSRYFVVTQTGVGKDDKTIQGAKLLLEKSEDGKTFNFDKCTITINGTATDVKNTCLWHIEGGRDR